MVKCIHTEVCRQYILKIGRAISRIFKQNNLCFRRITKMVNKLYTVNKIYDEILYQSKIFEFYFGSSRIGVFDIETTGLSPQDSSFILGGLLTPHPEGLKVQQYFAESKEEEAHLLSEYLNQMSHVDVLFSYNGDSFDLPFLKARLRHHDSCQDLTSSNCLPLQQSFDLYKVIHRYSVFRKFLPNLKQKTIEAFMGFWSQRADEISGAESVDLYYKYLGSKDSLIRDTILLHNLDDVLQLSRLLKVLEKVDLHRVMFHMGFMVAMNKKKALIHKIVLNKNAIIITGQHRNIPMDYRDYNPSHQAKFSVHTGDFQISIPFKINRYFKVVDLEEFQMDCSALEKYPGYQHGYLVIKNGDQLNYAEINHLSKLILQKILMDF